MDLFESIEREEKRETVARIESCRYCDEKSGIFTMACFGCCCRLIDGEHPKKRESCLLYAIDVAPADVAVKLQEHYGEKNP